GKRQLVSRAHTGGKSMPIPSEWGIFWLLLGGVCACGFALSILSCMWAAREGTKALLFPLSEVPATMTVAAQQDHQQQQQPAIVSNSSSSGSGDGGGQQQGVADGVAATAIMSTAAVDGGEASVAGGEQQRPIPGFSSSISTAAA
ncbi:unnamed protein product, partial [Ectocarpus sp. 4 AP-2014]